MDNTVQTGSGKPAKHQTGKPGKGAKPWQTKNHKKLIKIKNEKTNNKERKHTISNTLFVVYTYIFFLPFFSFVK